MDVRKASIIQGGQQQTRSQLEDPTVQSQAVDSLNHSFQTAEQHILMIGNEQGYTVNFGGQSGDFTAKERVMKMDDIKTYQVSIELEHERSIASLKDGFEAMNDQAILHFF